MFVLIYVCVKCYRQSVELGFLLISMNFIIFLNIKKLINKTGQCKDVKKKKTHWTNCF